jgi:23S rRNA G2445 N2-methylase RlmL
MAGRLAAQDKGKSCSPPKNSGQGLLELLFQNLATLIRDSDLKTALNAVTAMGQLPGTRTEDLLMGLWEGAGAEGADGGAEIRPEMRRTLIRSLGKVGGSRAKAALDAYATVHEQGDRLLSQSRLILDRSLARSESSAVTGEVELPQGSTVIFHGRRGLETFIEDELKDLLGQHHSKVTVTPGRVLWTVCRESAAKFARELQVVRCAERWALLPLGRGAELAKAGRIEEALVETLRDPEWQSWLQRMTIGPVRYRIDWREATTAEMWGLAERLKGEVPALVNDPRESLWEIGVIPATNASRDKSRLIEIRPKGLKDQRFAYRDGTVPASSHAPLAAALARLAGVRAEDVVWDPFCGAGTELIERALLGACASLWGTDLDDKALQVARRNIVRAGLVSADVDLAPLGSGGFAAFGPMPIQLQRADATQWASVRPSLTITNPPLGRRVARGRARELIRVVTTHIARTLVPGGRLVWVSPFPEETRRILAAEGLKLTYTKMVDMGGFDAEMQRADKPKL